MPNFTNNPVSQAFTPGPLRKEQIYYLVFEGGGGKGFAYLGAIHALEEQGILQYHIHPKTKKPMLESQIKGIGGASAGAITALLLSIGYSAKELGTWMEDKQQVDFDRFFDEPEPREVPRLGGCITVKDESRERRIAEETLPLFAPPFLLNPIQFILMALRMVQSKTQPTLLKPPLGILLTKFPAILSHMGKDMGIFSGCYARQVFDRLLAARMGIDKKRKPPYNVTFKEHFEHFGVKLAVTGTNLETGTTEVFCVPRYDELPVADAIRKSRWVCPFSISLIVSTVGVMLCTR